MPTDYSHNQKIFKFWHCQSSDMVEMANIFFMYADNTIS